MRYRKFLLGAASALLCGAKLVLAGPGGYLQLVNLSPYNWQLTYQHSYHMDWIPGDLIPAGGRHEQYVEWWYHWGDNGDCGAEATYQLVGTDLSFTIQARQTGGKKLLIEYSDALAALTMTKEKVIDLGFDHDGSVLFVMSGNGIEPYVTSQPPKNWTQHQLPLISTKELREISMPRSHNAGMNYVSYAYLGNAHNTQCQTYQIYHQLQFGSRWLDLRPALAHGKWLTSHVSKMSTGTYAGATGADFVDMIADINRFNTETPGELLILELSHEVDGADSGATHPLRDGLPPNRWQELYTLLEGIADLWRPTNPDLPLPEDLSTMPISTFIRPGSKSAVLIRLPPWAPAPDSGHPAFVHESRLPWVGEWIQTSDPAILDSSLTTFLLSSRTTPKSPLFRLAYTISPRVKDLIDVANSFHSIIGESMWVEHKLFQTIWEKLSPSTYPNLIEMDNIHNGQVAAVAMVINQRYVSAGAWKRGLRWGVRRDEVVEMGGSGSRNLDLETEHPKASQLKFLFPQEPATSTSQQLNNFTIATGDDLYSIAKAFSIRYTPYVYSQSIHRSTLPLIIRLSSDLTNIKVITHHDLTLGKELQLNFTLS
ncbi:PLC-like phosphodiesterase [Mollisia scopiformis]|uniref:PLC-like phosphodiesterase n=1 Tax=Mollisia scopiformis TaxID=149040 RepID=A0A194WVP7_MOLSC|nr:PLC-like phosphodiesterase [Mollisia scopiformis]KUJ12043.1 PLC-like phosphodiesterase [Mollisia scopiformis]